MFRKGSHKSDEYHGSQHRFEHWYRDNTNGCIRDELQCRRAYRYTLTQCRRHGICANPADYPHTHLNIDVDRAVRRVLELKAFLTDVPYKRYEGRR